MHSCRSWLLSLFGAYPRRLVFYNYFPRASAFSSLLSKRKIPVIDVTGALIPPVKYDAAHAGLPTVELAARFLMVTLLRRQGGQRMRPPTVQVGKGLSV